jgi:hypothetical protein
MESKLLLKRNDRRIDFYIDEDLHEEIVQMAQGMEITKSRLARVLLRLGLERFKQQKAEEGTDDRKSG